MCGIVGFTGREQAAPILLDGLSKLEYRKSSNMSTGQQKSPHFQRGLSGSCKNNKCIKNQDFLYLLGHSF